MKLTIAGIGKTKDAAIAALTQEYLKRIGRYSQVESAQLRGETALLDLATKQRAQLIVLDSRGREFTSGQFAEFLRKQQDNGIQRIIFAVGPADGFTDSARQAANFQLSLGKMTLAHELALVVLLEQIYRAFTILKGHPYHTGH